MGFSVVFPKIASDFFFKRASYLRSFRFGAENCPEDDPRFAPQKKDLSPCGATIRVMFNNLMKWSTPWEKSNMKKLVGPRYMSS